MPSVSPPPSSRFVPCPLGTFVPPKQSSIVANPGTYAANPAYFDCTEEISTIFGRGYPFSYRLNKTHRHHSAKTLEYWKDKSRNTALMAEGKEALIYFLTYIKCDWLKEQCVNCILTDKTKTILLQGASELTPLELFILQTLNQLSAQYWHHDSPANLVYVFRVLVRYANLYKLKYEI
jgi:hypothetical protein